MPLIDAMIAARDPEEGKAKEAIRRILYGTPILWPDPRAEPVSEPQEAAPPNTSMLKRVQEIEAAYETANAHGFWCGDDATRRFDRLLDTLPTRAWIE